MSANCSAIDERELSATSPAVCASCGPARCDEDGFGACHGFEAEHGPDAALDASMVLVDPVVEVFAPADADGL